MIVLVLVLLSITSVFSAQIHVLPEAGSYEIVNERLNWTAAGAACEARGKELATIDTEDKLNVVLTQLNDEGYVDTDVFWIGARDLYENLNYKWITTNKVVDNWANGQPNGGVEHCVSTYYYGINDFDCVDQFSFICE